MGYWGYYAPYVSVGEKRAKAARKLKQLKKKNRKSWNRNLERYADYSNRIGRGRSYVRHGAVLDLQVNQDKGC